MLLPAQGILKEEHRTPAERFRHEIPKIKGSRFIASVAPIENEQAAKLYIDGVRRELHAARHHGSAWRLGLEGKDTRFDDDGEPNGSTGRPILQEIQARDLTDVVVVVTRYFGGTKLGVGGLVRAYGGAAAAALDLAPLKVTPITQGILLRYPYECAGAIGSLLSARALAPARAEYGEEVEMELRLPLGSADGFLAEVIERTAGRAQAQKNGAPGPG